MHCIATGSKAEVAIAARRATDAGAAGPVLIFDNATGRSIDLDLRGSDAQIRKRYADAAQPGQESSADASEGLEPSADDSEPAEPRGRGRPRLGVVAREVTLLPRHWDWLATQPGGASVALRKLVEEARRVNAERDRLRDAQQRAYHFMSAMAGNLSGFEEASRALFANDDVKLREQVDAWPEDVKRHMFRLLQD
jgi:uncharacterized protein